MLSLRPIRAFGLSLALGLSVNTFAQGIQFANEIKGYEFYGQGKLKGLALKTSTRDDVKLAFGSDCDWTYCDYNDKWEVMFVYLESLWPYRDVKGDYVYELAPFPQFVERLWIIDFKAKKSLPLPRRTFSHKFDKEATQMLHAGTDILYYRDPTGLIYTVLNEGVWKGNLLNITYRVPLADRKDMFFVIGQRYKADIVQPRLIQN
jgi:hypothetical protein